MNILNQLRKKLEQFDEWRTHKKSLRFMRKRYKEEIASHKISEDYLVQLISDYPGEDQKKAKLRNDLVQTQQTIQNLELLINFLKHAK